MKKIISLILIFSSLLYVIDLCVNKAISGYLGRVTLYVPLCLLLGYFIYLLIIIIWWEIADHKDMKLLQNKHDKEDSSNKGI